MAEYSKYQQKIIKRYYDNADEIQLQKLQELVTNLYLAEGKKKETLWKNAATSLEKLKVPATRVAHILEKKDVVLLGKLVQELFDQK
ncbi:MAG TPA: hypothetical protein VGE52_02980 [Pirellulales bacterium]